MRSYHLRRLLVSLFLAAGLLFCSSDSRATNVIRMDAGFANAPDPGTEAGALNGTPLPDTGQTQSYTTIFGEDSDYLINPPSYTKLDQKGQELPDNAAEWAMVRDNVTGLIWEVKTDDDTLHDKDAIFSWDYARFDYMRRLNEAGFGGFTDWRLPYIREISCMVNPDHYWPALNMDYFPNCRKPDPHYWSYDLIHSDVNQAYVVLFGYGDIGSYKRTELKHVRAVRGYAAWEEDDYVDNGDGTVTDRFTGLMWQQAASENQMDWETALSYCQDLSLAGREDWRLPNRNELQSLVDKQPEPGAYVCINQAFPNTLGEMYWTSTSNAIIPNAAYAVSFHLGVVFARGSKDLEYRVRAVRGGTLPGASRDDLS